MYLYNFDNSINYHSILIINSKYHNFKNLINSHYDYVFFSWVGANILLLTFDQFMIFLWILGLKINFEITKKCSILGSRLL